MDQTRQHTIIFDDFSGGEFGDIAPDKAPPNTFTATNMVLYDDGTIGPRAGLQRFAFTGVTADPVTGVVWRGTAPDLAAFIGSSVLRYDTLTEGAEAAFTGTITGTPTQPVQGFEYGNNRVYVTVYADQSYVLDFVAGTVTALTASPGGTDTCLYGERMIVVGDDAQPQRLYYSAALDFNDWPAANFIDVGNASGALVGCWAQRGHLVILTQNGEWWVLTGVPGTGTLRRVSGGGVHPWNAYTDAWELLGSDIILGVPISADYPSTFNGATVVDYRQLRINDSAPQLGAGTIKVVHGFRPDEAIIIFPGTAGNNRVALYSNGVWTFHTFNVEISEFAVSDRQGRIFLTDGGATTTAANWYQWYLPLDRPAFVSDTFATVGDDSDTTPVTAEITFPEQWAPEGREWRLRQVIVDFTKYDIEAAPDNEFQVEVTSLGRYAEAGSSAVTKTWTESGLQASGTGVRDRQVFNYGADVRFGGGFQLRLHTVRGVKFRTITVVLEDRKYVPRF